ncbi:MAG: diguanylate cyclase [Gammaproteobacteria bacterium]|nr:diguanylate cyclase [Gammaproteobacteria bacterium]
MIDLVNLPASFIKSLSYFNEQLMIDWGLCSRSHLPLSLFIIEIDDYQNFTSLYGKEAADNCILAVATALNATLRREFDFIAQADTNIFIFLADDMSFKQAGKFAEKCHLAVRDQAIVHQGSLTSEFVTISIGHTTCTPESVHCNGPQNLIKTATKHLNRAIKSGGNCSKTTLKFKS